jgi:hypothetical protein
MSVTTRIPEFAHGRLRSQGEGSDKSRQQGARAFLEGLGRLMANKIYRERDETQGAFT